MKRLFRALVVMFLLATVLSGCAVGGYVGRSSVLANVVPIPISDVDIIAVKSIIVPPVGPIINPSPTVSVLPEPTPVPGPVPVTISPADHSGRTTHALIGNQWIYMENYYEVYSIPLDAPEGTQPKLLWKESGFEFFLVWQDDVLLFANTPAGAPMRAIRVNPETGEYRIYDMRQKFFYFPSWTDGNLAYGVGGNTAETRILNGDTGETSLMLSDTWWHGASDYHFFLDNGTYSRPFLRDAKNPSGPDIETITNYTFLGGVGGGALVRVGDDIVLVRNGDARLLFKNLPSDSAYNPYLYQSFTPDSELFELDLSPTAKDVLGNSYSGAVLITSDGVMSVSMGEYTNRPASYEGGALVFPSLDTDDMIPIDNFPEYDFFK